MSRTEDRQRSKKAYWRGFFAGKYAEPCTNNPYRSIESRLHWDNGWANGNEALQEVEAIGHTLIPDVLRGRKAEEGQ